MKLISSVHRRLGALADRLVLHAADRLVEGGGFRHIGDGQVHEDHLAHLVSPSCATQRLSLVRLMVIKSNYEVRKNNF
jgi:hypothetical protein